MPSKVAKPYRLFSRFVFRTPCFPLQNTSFSGADQDVFAEALFLASPEFFSEWTKSTEAGAIPLKQKITYYKYASRARSRCTPFGLFAGCSVGCFGDHTSVRLSAPESCTRCTRLDMNYVCALVQYLESLPEVIEQIRYFPNNSLYEYGGRLRYVQYYLKKAARVHRLTSVEPTDYLYRVLRLAENGATLGHLTKALADAEISCADARQFILALIKSQLLKSELEVSVTGDSPLTTLLEKLRLISGIEPYVSSLARIKDILETIDRKPVGQTLPLYESIKAEVDKLGVEYDLKYLFQTDMFKPSDTVLSTEIGDGVLQAVSFLSAIADPIPKETNLTCFKEAFAERYEEAEVPLLEVLDNDLGIGYPVRKGYVSDVNPFIDDLYLPGHQGDAPSFFRRRDIDVLLQRKYAQAIGHGETVVRLEESDLESVSERWSDLPDTFSVMCKVLRSNPASIFIQSVGGASAGNVLGRFCHLAPEIYDLTKEITDKEQELHPDAILAEIVHLSEARIGNILSRPTLRAYEIPYLVRSGVRSEYQLPLSDLVVSVRGGRIRLRSVRHGKEVIAHLTTAHNYGVRALPVYHFLCDLQTQEQRNSLSFRWGDWAEGAEYLPRVEYRGYILARQRWRFRQSEIEELDKTDDSVLLLGMDRLAANRRLPQRFVIPDADNELLIDRCDPLSVRTMLQHVAKRPWFYVEEFLFEPDQWQSRVLGPYTNEFVFSFYRANN